MDFLYAGRVQCKNALGVFEATESISGAPSLFQRLLEVLKRQRSLFSARRVYFSTHWRYLRRRSLHLALQVYFRIALEVFEATERRSAMVSPHACRQSAMPPKDSRRSKMLRRWGRRGRMLPSS